MRNISHLIIQNLIDFEFMAIKSVDGPQLLESENTYKTLQK